MVGADQRLGLVRRGRSSTPFCQTISPPFSPAMSLEYSAISAGNNVARQKAAEVEAEGQRTIRLEIVLRLLGRPAAPE